MLSKLDYEKETFNACEIIFSLCYLLFMVAADLKTKNRLVSSKILQQTRSI